MKSLKEYSLNLPESEYHAYPAWSHSLISRYAREGFSAISTIHEPLKPTPAMEFGSLFDSILTRGKETLNEYVVDDTSIAPAEKSVFDWLLANGSKKPFEQINEAELNAAIEASPTFASKYKKPETRIQKLQEVAQYYEVRRSGKKIVSTDDWKDAIEMARAFRSNDYLNKLFGIKNTGDVEYIYQAQFVVEVKDNNGNPVKVKIMPDLLVVKHKEKTIQPVDLKTSAQPAYDFKESFLKFRYDLEASVYTDVLQIVINGDEDYKDYTILPYLFTDISRTDKVPVTYIYDPHDESQADGFCYSISGKTYKHKHWTTLLGEMITYEEENAVVPEYVKLDKPNDIMSFINRD